MHTWQIFFEDADTDEPRRYLGEVQADTMAEALQLAAEYYEYDSADLMAVQESDG